MDRAAFYASLRRRNSGVFGTSLSQKQVEGCEAILDECIAVGATLPEAAYILATGYGETGGKMQPARENLNYSVKRLREVWPRRFPTNAAARPYAYNPRALAAKVYNGRMGNRPGTDDGWIYRGGGIGQITGRENHAKWGERLGLHLLGEPELMEDLRVSVRALVRPMIEGWATGLKLSQFLGGANRDYLNARAVWGGVDAEKYVGYAKAFEHALIAAGYTGEAAKVPKDYAEPPARGGTPAPAPEAPGGPLARLWAALAAMLPKRGR